MASSIYGFAADISKQLPRGIEAVYVKKSSESGYSTLGELRNGRASIKGNASQNTKKRSQIYSHIASYVFEMKQASLVEIELLDALIAGDVDIIIKTVDSQYYVHNAANTRLGIKFRIVNDAKIDTNRFIELQMQVGLLSSELDTVLPNVAPTINAPQTSDTFWSIANTGSDVDNKGRPENIRPAGVSALEICALSESSYDDVGEVTDVVLTFETFGRISDRLRHRPVGITVAGSFDLLQDSATEKANLDLFQQYGANIKVTHFDSLVWTLANKVGINYEELNDGDFDDHKRIRLIIDGSILKSDLDSVVS